MGHDIKEPWQDLKVTQKAITLIFINGKHYLFTTSETLRVYKQYIYETLEDTKYKSLQNCVNQRNRTINWIVIEKKKHKLELF